MLRTSIHCTAQTRCANVCAVPHPPAIMCCRRSQNKVLLTSNQHGINPRCFYRPFRKEGNAHIIMLCRIRRARNSFLGASPATTCSRKRARTGVWADWQSDATTARAIITPYTERRTLLAHGPHRSGCGPDLAFQWRE